MTIGRFQVVLGGYGIIAGLMAIGRHWPHLAFWLGVTIGAAFIAGSLMLLVVAFQRQEVYGVITAVLVAFAGVGTIYGGVMARRFGSSSLRSE